ncbi:MFS general substrate transporter [Microthyrium microscopicum]|uniref:MFS general substrate transporter n=1 Tax=Microthyrium microscopicum TaxID=703497 RepID=A0A6A6UF11_9PEZI|nr:MFS general substrate transporter [Microthyrium microscopicum]
MEKEEGEGLAYANSRHNAKPIKEPGLETGHQHITPARSIQSQPPRISPSITRTSTRSRLHGGHDGFSIFGQDEGSDEDVTAQVPEGDPEKKRDTDEGKFRVKFNGETDPMSPRSMGRLRKWSIVLIVSLSSLCVTCTSSLYTFTYTQIIPEFHTSEELATLGLSIFVAGLGLGPMVLAPLSEFYGRRLVYIVSYIFFIIWLLPCALAPNLATLLVARFLSGLSGSAFLSVAGGTVGDMFTRAELSTPMMVYTASPFIGPEVGPLIGGFINQYANWRWSFWVLMIWAGVQLTLIVLFVPETYHPVVLRNKARKLRKETGDQRYKAQIEIMDRSIPKKIMLSCTRPFELLFLEPMCLNLCLLSAILLGIIYLFFGAFTLVFENNHDFQLWQIGLTFLGIFAGMIIGIGCNSFLWDTMYLRLCKREQERRGEEEMGSDPGASGASEPEFRLPPTIAGAVLVPIGLFGFAWTTYPSVHWIVPIISSGIFGLGTVWCFSGIFTFLVECYPLYAASALAANSFARSSFAAAFPLFGVQMYNKLGYQWATSLLAFLALAMAPFPYIFYKYGKRIRGKSRFAISI